MKKILLALFVLLAQYSFGQTVGSKVTFKAADGRFYTGTIREIANNQFRVGYDGTDFEAWLTPDQFTTVPVAGNSTINDISPGSKVSFVADNGQRYTGTVKQINGNRYNIQYDGYSYEAWMTADQFQILSTKTKPTTGTFINKSTDANPVYAAVNAVTDVRSLFNFGKAKGWTTGWQEDKLNDYLNKLSPDQYKSLLQFLNGARTASARFFVLKSLLGGDEFETLQRFINELNQYNETYQQEHCLITTHKSIIQQWQYTCSVTVVQTFLGDICPRYAWDVKKVPDFDVAAADPYTNPMGIQQKELIEKYGGTVSIRNDYSGKIIPINSALNDYVGTIMYKHFDHYAVTEALPTVLSSVRAQLDKGIDVPLLVGFAGTTARHFLLTLRYRNAGNGYQYLIYDPWDGVCDYVSEDSLMQGSLAPLNNTWKITLDFYYLAN